MIRDKDTVVYAPLANPSNLLAINGDGTLAANERYAAHLSSSPHCVIHTKSDTTHGPPFCSVCLSVFFVLSVCQSVCLCLCMSVSVCLSLSVCLTFPPRPPFFFLFFSPPFQFAIAVFVSLPLLREWYDDVFCTRIAITLISLLITLFGFSLRLS